MKREKIRSAILFYTIGFANGMIFWGLLRLAIGGE